MARRPAGPVVPDPLQAARRALQAANKTMARHYCECARCCQARWDVTRFCDAGYALAKVIARTSAAVRRAEDRKRGLPAQGALF